MKSFLIAGVITVVSWIAEYLLCTKLKNPLWGGIIPLLAIVFTIWCFASGRIAFNYTSFFAFFIINIVTLEGWNSGRKKYKKQQEAELDKMKAHDMNSFH